MTEKVLSIDTSRDSREQLRDLVAALKLTTAIAEDQLLLVLVASTKTDSFGVYDLSTLAEYAKPDFERYSKAVVAAHNALRKAEGEKL